MTTYTQPAQLSDVLKREWEHLYNREQVIVASGQNLTLGTIVGKVTASGEYKAYAAGNADGSETAAGIVINNYDATAAAINGVILARGPAVVARTALTGLDAAAEINLLALGIVVRDDV